MRRWSGRGVRVVAIVPEFDDYLPPDAATKRFAIVPEIEVVAVAGAKHLWVGENQAARVLNEIVAIVRPESVPLPVVWTDELD